MEEPATPAPTPNPRSTPHSASNRWLAAAPAEEPPAADADDLLQEEPETITMTRRDGWTPFARRLFLEVLAETGRVSLACEYAQLTKQSAYALRARDPLFAAGWDAACELARAPLADALYEKAVDGVTDTIRKDGEVVAERHRFDSRLSIAVLHRLDKRCDRAVELGSRHLPLVRHWDEWLRLVGKGEEQAARAFLESTPHGQFGQLPESENPTGEADEDDGIDLSHRFWRDEIDEVWMTDFPPPAGFTGYQRRDYDDFENEERYVRVCTEEEIAILDADEKRERAAERADDERLRDEWLAMLKAEADEAAASAQHARHDGEADGGEQRRGHSQAEESPRRDHQPVGAHETGEQASEELGDVPSAHRHRGEAHGRQGLDEGQADRDHEQLAESQQEEIAEYPERADVRAAGAARERGKHHGQHRRGGDDAADRHPLQ